MTLRFKLLVLVGGVALFSATGVTSVALWREVVQAHEQLACEGATVAGSIAQAAPRWFGQDGPLPEAATALLPLLQKSVTSQPLLRAWIVDRDGNVTACFDRSGLGCPRGAPSAFHPPEGPIAALQHLVGRNPLEASAPIIHGGELAGAVRISYRADGMLAAARHLAGTAALVAGVWIALGVLLGTILVRRMEKTISTLNERVAKATEEGFRAERLATLGGIAAGFAHEMGNSLHVISGFNAVVLRELPKDHPNRADLDSVKREATRASAMLERFLFFARARSARPATQSVEPVVREAVEVIGPAAAENNVATAVEVEPQLPPVRFDAETLRQAFVNLCVNAVQAMDKKRGGKLTVRALRRDPGVAVEFEDSGPGVDALVRERIFEPFFTTKPNGTGLGLAIVRQAAEATGGTVEVENAAGHGAIFRIRLPAAAQESTT